MGYKKFKTLAKDHLKLLNQHEHTERMKGDVAIIVIFTHQNLFQDLNPHAAKHFN